jgi:hypothetical protein
MKWKTPRLLAGMLLEFADQVESDWYSCIPVTLRVQKADGSTVDLDATGVHFSLNSGILYITAKE